MKKKALIVGNTGFAVFHFRLSLIKYLSEKNWLVIAVANDEANFANKFAREGIKFVNIQIDHKGKNPIADLILIWKLKILYQKEAPNLVHHFTDKPVIFGTLAAKLANIPAIVNTITGLNYSFIRGGFLWRIVKNLYKLAFKGRLRIIFQNTDDFNLFISNKLVRKENARIILGSGVDTNIIRPNTFKKHNDGLRFLLVSRMLWSKGVREYVHAAEKVKKQFPETSFIMAGGASGGGAQGNPDAVPEQWLSEVNKKGYIKWLGRIPFKDVCALLDKSDIVVLPSYYPEGVPRILIESAAKGKPIITTNSRGCKEVVINGINGFLVPQRDIESLSNCMYKFIQRSELIERMGKASRERAVNLFDEKKILDQTAKVYGELCIF